MNNSIVIEGKKFISSRRASEITKYTNDYVGQLCRSGKIHAQRVGRAWFVEEASILAHQKNSLEQLVSNGQASAASVSEVSSEQAREEKTLTETVAQKSSETKESTHVEDRLKYTSRHGAMTEVMPLRGPIRAHTASEVLSVPTLPEQVASSRWIDMNGYVHDALKENSNVISYESDVRDLLPKLSKPTPSVAPKIVTKSLEGISEVKVIVPDQKVTAKLEPINVTDGKRSSRVSDMVFFRNALVVTSVLFILLGFGGLGYAGLVQSGIKPLRVLTDIGNKGVTIVSSALHQNIKYSPMAQKTVDEDSMAASVLDSISGGWRSFTGGIRTGVRSFLGIRDVAPVVNNVTNIIATTTPAVMTAVNTVIEQPRITENTIYNNTESFDPILYAKISSLEESLRTWQSHQLRQDYAIMDKVLPEKFSDGNITGIGGTFSGDITAAALALSNNLTVTGGGSFDNGTLYIDAANNRVGIGTSSPTDTLAVNGPIYLGPISAPGATAGRLYNLNDDLYFAGNLIGGATTGNWATDGTNAWRMTGNVGVGSSSPNSSLVVNGDTGITLTESGGRTFNINGPVGGAKTMFSNLGVSIGYGFAVGGTEQFSISSAGSIGVGTTTPRSRISVTGIGTTGLLSLANSSNVDQFTVDSVGNVVTGGNIRFGANSGGSGIFGYSSSGAQILSLTRQNNTQNGTAAINAYGGFGIVTNNTSGAPTENYSMFVNTAGNVGIGTTSPQNSLVISKSVAGDVGPVITLHNSGNNLNDAAEIQWTDGFTSNTPRAKIQFRTPSIGGLGRGVIGFFSGGTSNGSGMTETLTMSSNSISGLVGIGSTTPYAKLSVKGVGSTTGVNFQTTNSSDLPLFTILDSGNIGVGTNNPLDKFTVEPTTNKRIGVREVTSSLISDFVTGGAGFQFSRATDGANNIASIFHYVNGASTPNLAMAVRGDLVFATGGASDYTAASEIMRITKDGTVGIGDSGADALLEVSASAGASDLLMLSSDDNNNGNLFIVKNSGNVGIGTTSPWGRLSVTGSGTGSEAGFVFADSNNSPKVTMLNNGNVGIGTTTPNAALNVYSANYPVGAFVRTTTSASNSRLSALSVDANTTQNMTDGFGPMIAFRVTDSGAVERPLGNIGMVRAGGDDTGDFVVLPSTNGAANERLRVTSAGNVGIGTTSPLAKLDVAGALFQTSPLFQVSKVGLNYATTTSLIVDFNGRVGIGIVSPLAPLSVQTGASADQALAQTWNYSSGSTNASLYNLNLKQAVTSGVVRWGFDLTNNGTSYSDVLVLDRGNVGIGTTSPVAKLSVKGGGTTTGVNFQTTDSSDSQLFTILDNGTVLFSDGSAATPSISWNSDNDGAGTGLYRAAANEITFSINGGRKANIFRAADGGGTGAIALGTDSNSYVWGGSNILGFNTSASERMRITSTGNVGIGTTSPWGRLSVTGSGTGSEAGFVFADSNNSPKVTMLNNGNVGIGTTTPLHKLSVVGSGSSPASIQLGGMSGNLNPGDENGRLTWWAVDGSTNGVGESAFIGNVVDGSSAGTQHSLIFGTKNAATVAEKLRINYDGNVGIGTTSPVSKLSVLGESAFAGGASVGIGYAGTAAPTGGMIIQGNVGIGTTAPGGKLQIAGSAFTTAYNTLAGLTIDNSFVTAGNGNYGTGIEFTKLGSALVKKAAIVPVQDSGDSNTLGLGFFVSDGTSVGTNPLIEALRIRSGGNVGIGTTSPWARLSVTGSGATSATYGLVVADSNNSPKMVVRNDGNVGIGTTTPWGRLSVTGSGTGSEAGFVFADSNNSPKVTMLNNGNVGIGTTSPWGKLSITQTGTAGAPAFIVEDSASPDSSPFVIDQTGNVGIGTTSPGTKLDVFGTQNATLTTFTQSVANNAIALSSGLTQPSYNPGLVWYTSDNNPTKPKAGIWTQNTVTGSYMYLGTSNAYATGITNQAVTIDPTGNVGIGTTSPWGRLSVTGSGTGSEAGFVFADSNNSPKVTMLNNGKVGIGTESPSGLLHVYSTGTAIEYITGGTASDVGLYLGDTAQADRAGFTYRNATDELGIKVNASEKVTISSTGNVGIGTTNPLSNLQIKSATNKEIQFGSTAAFFTNSTYFTELTALSNTINFSRISDGQFTESVFGYIGAGGISSLGLAARGDIKFVTGAVADQGLIIKNTGNVGIGTTSPVSKLSVLGESAFAGGASVGIGYAGTAAPTGGMIIQGNVGIGTTSPWGRLSVTGSGATSATYGLVVADSNNSPKMVVRNDGNVGIGTTNPGVMLQLAPLTGSGSAETIRFSNTQGTYYNSITTGLSSSAHGSNYLGFSIARIGGGIPTEVLRMTGDGNVGIGTTTPWGRLSVTGSGATSATYGLVVADSNNSPKMVVRNDGNVGIGTTSPVSKLSVLGESAFAGGASVGIGYAGTAAPTGGMIIQGNVGIGTTSPDSKLDVYGNQLISSGGAWSIGSISGIGSNAKGLHFGYDNTNSISYIKSLFNNNSFKDLRLVANKMSFWTDNDTGASSERLTITTAGNVGIGTTNPTQKLQVNGHCVTGDTLLPIRRRRKGKKGEKGEGEGEPDPKLGNVDTETDEGEWEYLMVPIKDIQTGDEVLSLNKNNGLVEYHPIKGLMDMGVKDVYELKTRSGRVIRTTSTHPYLVKLQAKESSNPNKRSITQTLTKVKESIISHITNSTRDTKISENREILTPQSSEISREIIAKPTSSVDLRDAQKCPYCESSDFVRRGTRKNKHQTVQLYLCRNMECAKTFTASDVKGKHFPLRVIIEGMSYYNLGLNLVETCQVLKKKFDINPGTSTLSDWINQYKSLCTFGRLREYAIKMFSPKNMVEVVTMAHRQLYRFRYHRAKIVLMLQEFKNRTLGPLKDYLDSVSSETPHQYFAEGERMSEVKSKFDKTDMIVKGKFNYANKLADFVLQAVKDNKQRHEELQRFMIANDSCTVATEVPVYIRREDVAHMENVLKFSIVAEDGKIEIKGGKRIDMPKLLTGHIDFVQVRNGQVHLLDYKPNAAKEKPIEQLTWYALAMSRLTGLRIFNFTCAWFDEKDYFEFYPLHVVKKLQPTKKKRKVFYRSGETAEVPKENILTIISREKVTTVNAPP